MKLPTTHSSSFIHRFEKLRSTRKALYGYESAIAGERHFRKSLFYPGLLHRYFPSKNNLADFNSDDYYEMQSLRFAPKINRNSTHVHSDDANPNIAMDTFFETMNKVRNNKSTIAKYLSQLKEVDYLNSQFNQDLHQLYIWATNEEIQLKFTPPKELYTPSPSDCNIQTDSSKPNPSDTVYAFSKPEEELSFLLQQCESKLSPLRFSTLIWFIRLNRHDSDSKEFQLLALRELFIPSDRQSEEFYKPYPLMTPSINLDYLCDDLILFRCHIDDSFRRELLYINNNVQYRQLMSETVTDMVFNPEYAGENEDEEDTNDKPTLFTFPSDSLHLQHIDEKHRQNLMNSPSQICVHINKEMKNIDKLREMNLIGHQDFSVTMNDGKLTDFFYKKIRNRFLSHKFRRQRLTWIRAVVNGHLDGRKEKDRKMYFLQHPDDMPVFPTNFGNDVTVWPSPVSL